MIDVILDCGIAKNPWALHSRAPHPEKTLRARVRLFGVPVTLSPTERMAEMLRLPSAVGRRDLRRGPHAPKH